MARRVKAASPPRSRANASTSSRNARNMCAPLGSWSPMCSTSVGRSWPASSSANRYLSVVLSNPLRTRLAVICEAAGMVPQLARVAAPYGIPVMSSSGFESTTDKYRFAEELAGHDRPTEVLHIGDHDPSGAHMFLAFLEDVEAFARDLGGEAAFTRLAMTPEQIDRLRLPTAPPKESDNRAFYGATCQAEAIAPDDLATILREAIEARIDQRALSRVRRQEAKARRELIEQLGG